MVYLMGMSVIENKDSLLKVALLINRNIVSKRIKNYTKIILNTYHLTTIDEDV